MHLMSRLRSVRIIPTLLALSLRRRPYFTVEGMDDSPVSSLDLSPNELPRAVKINGRYVCPLSGGAKKSFADVATWLWTSKKSRLSLPSYRYQEKEYIQPVVPNYELAVSRIENKVTWVCNSLTQHFTSLCLIDIDRILCILSLFCIALDNLNLMPCV
jgi:hypothetical protein